MNNPVQMMEIDEINDFLKEILGIEAGFENSEELENPEVRGRFKILNIDQATWGMRKLEALNVKKSEINATADSEIERIEKWRVREVNHISHSISFFEALLSEYMLFRRGTDPKFKSESTPYGRITFTKQQPEWNYEDEHATAEYLLGVDGMSRYAKVVKSIGNKTELKKAVEIKRDVFIEDQGESVEIVVDAANVDSESGRVWGMEYELLGDKVVSLETGEYVDNVRFASAVVVVNAVYVVPGIKVADRADKIVFKV